MKPDAQTGKGRAELTGRIFGKLRVLEYSHNIRYRSGKVSTLWARLTVLWWTVRQSINTPVRSYPRARV